MRRIIADFRGALISLRNNSRRKEHEPFERPADGGIVETEYDFPEVSEEERQRVVRKILRKRGCW